jgi:hypothetical protein
MILTILWTTKQNRKSISLPHLEPLAQRSASLRSLASLF